jgi:hypothetical protein
MRSNTVLAAVLSSVAALIAAGLFVFVSYASRTETASCEIPNGNKFPWTGDGRLVPGMTVAAQIGILCRQNVKYWWQG